MAVLVRGHAMQNSQTLISSYVMPNTFGAGIKPPHRQIEGVINPLNATVCHCLITPGNDAYRYLVVQHEAFGHPRALPHSHGLEPHSCLELQRSTIRSVNASSAGDSSE